VREERQARKDLAENTKFTKLS